MRAPTVKRLVDIAIREMKGNYTDAKGRFKSVPLYFFWGYFKDNYSEYGCLMSYCHHWGIYYADDLKDLTRDEFNKTWAEVNRDAESTEGSRIVSEVLASLRMRFKPSSSYQRTLFELVIDYQGKESPRAKELERIKRDKLFSSLVNEEKNLIPKSSWKAYSEIIRTYQMEKCI